MSNKEPSPRFWHLTFSYNNHVYLRGGRTSDFESKESEVASNISCFDSVSERWKEIKTEGTPHPGLTQAACVCVDGILYVYGSPNKKILSQLNMETFVWSQLWESLEKDDGKSPMVKTSAGMAYFCDGHLGVFGGYACPSGPFQPGSECRPNSFDKSRGWTNEFHLFKIHKSMQNQLQ